MSSYLFGYYGQLKSNSCCLTVSPYSLLAVLLIVSLLHFGQINDNDDDDDDDDDDKDI